MARTVPEPKAELLTAEDVQQDVASLTAALERRRAERRAYDLLARHEVREMLNRLITSVAGSPGRRVSSIAPRNL